MKQDKQPQTQGSSKKPLRETIEERFKDVEFKEIPKETLRAEKYPLVGLGPTMCLTPFLSDSDEPTEGVWLLTTWKA